MLMAGEHVCVRRYDGLKLFIDSLNFWTLQKKSLNCSLAEDGKGLRSLFINNRHGKKIIKKLYLLEETFRALFVLVGSFRGYMERGKFVIEQ